MIGPEPMTSIRWMSVRLGIQLGTIHWTKLANPVWSGTVFNRNRIGERSSCSWQSRKREPQGLPFSFIPSTSLSSGPASRSAHNLPCVQASGANLHLGDLAIDNDARDLKVWLPGPARLVVRVRDVVSVSDSLVADVAAVSLYLWL